jgi:tyrosine-specific transport protein
MIIRQIGSVYLILGTCIAAGLLAVPIVTATNTFSFTVIMLFSAWILMSIGAWCISEVNLWFAPDSNLITMSQETLGSIVKGITWIAYLFLLYSLISAYLAASSDILHALFLHEHFDMPRTLCTLLATLILGSIVYKGIRAVDFSNRILMSTKLLIAIAIIAHLLPKMDPSMLMVGGHHFEFSAWLVLITSFGFAILMPSIRVYLHSSRKRILTVLAIGAFLPLVLYVLWIAAVQGVIPRSGADGLLAMNHAANTTSALMGQLAVVAHYPIMTSLSILFVSICSITGLLGVSLCLVDFLADGFRMVKQGGKHFGLILLTFIPPMIIVMFWPQVFVAALAYAGALCIYILIALPIAMYIAGIVRGKNKAFVSKVI